SMFSFSSSGPPRDLHSFPTRRSSDLVPVLAWACWPRGAVLARPKGAFRRLTQRQREAKSSADFQIIPRIPWLKPSLVPSASVPRSEEHTSELQSRSDLVCRLLLEKKK